MTYEVGFLVTFVILCPLYLFIMREDDGTIKIGNICLSIGISVMFASAWPVVWWGVGICFVGVFVFESCKLIENCFGPVVSKISNIRVKI